MSVHPPAPAHNRTNAHLWCASTHECASLQQAMRRFAPICIVLYLSRLTPPPIRLTNQPTTSPHAPHNPAPASSEADLKSERHHEKWLRMVGAPTNPNDGNDRHTTVPNAAATHQPAGRKASTARTHRRNRAQPEHSGGAAPQRGQPRQPVVTQLVATRHAAAPRCSSTAMPHHRDGYPPRAQLQPQHRR